MSDLANYFGLKDRICELEAELLAMTLQHAKEIAKLELAVKNQACMKRKARLSAERALLKDKRPDWAVRLVKEKHQGRDITLKEIAKECRLSLSRVKSISSEVLTGLRD